MKKSSQLFFHIFTLLVLLLIVKFALNHRQQILAPQITEAAVASPTVVATTDLTISITATQSGQTALDLLVGQHQVEQKKYSFGVFIQAIDGKAGDDHNFWSLKINGEKSEVGADQAKLKAGDVATFTYEAVQ